MHGFDTHAGSKLRAAHGDQPVAGRQSAHQILLSLTPHNRDTGFTQTVVCVNQQDSAIVFGSGRIAVATMARAGIVINLIAIMVLSALAMWWMPYVLPAVPG